RVREDTRDDGQADRAASAHPGEARGHGDGVRGGARAAVPVRADGRRRPRRGGADEGVRDGEAQVRRRRDGCHDRGRSDPRRVLIDPVQPAARADAVLLTVPWHRRAADELELPVLDEPPPGIEAWPGFFAEERAYWLPAHWAIVLGDAYVDGSAAPIEWASDDPDAPARLRALLELPFELVLPTHGEVTDRATFEASLRV